jgi:hypothetical protein
LTLSYIEQAMRTRLNLNAGPRADAGQQSHVQRIRRALGSVAARNPAVFWLYPDQSGAWWVRREGDESERRFDDREQARYFLGIEASRCASYRLFQSDGLGYFAVNSFDWPLSA